MARISEPDYGRYYAQQKLEALDILLDITELLTERDVKMSTLIIVAATLVANVIENTKLSKAEVMLNFTRIVDDLLEDAERSQRGQEPTEL
jgi:hypothetical protein